MSVSATDAVDTQHSRKSLRVRGIRAETPPPLTDLKKSRKNDANTEPSPPKQQDKPCSNQDTIASKPQLDDEVAVISQDDDVQVSGEFLDSPVNGEIPPSDETQETAGSVFGTTDVLEVCEAPENRTRKSLTFCSEEDQLDVDDDVRPIEPDVNDDVRPNQPDVKDDVRPEVDDDVISNVDVGESRDDASVIGPVLVDQAILCGLLDRAVMVTSKATVSELEWLYSQLTQLVYKHRMELEKSGLVRDMDECIQRFELQKKK